MKTDILVIPDSHAQPGHEPIHMAPLGRWIVQQRPEYVIHLGDGADMESIMTHHSKYSAEMQRYDEDIRAFIEADKALWAPLEEYNLAQQRNRKRMWFPNSIYLIGNHEQRIERLAHDQPVLLGKVGLDDLQLEKRWNNVVPYRVPAYVGGIGFTHNVASGIMGRSLGQPNLARKVAQKQKMSWVVGHDHTFDVHVDKTGDGRKFITFSAGCFLPPTWEAEYAGGEHLKWSNGVLVLRNVRGGWPHDGWDWISTERLLRDYS